MLMSAREPRLPTYRKSVHRFGRKKKGSDPFQSLESMAWMLNISKGKHPLAIQPWTDAWQWAGSVIASVNGDIPAVPGKTILTSGNLPPSLEWGTINYNRLMRNVPVRLVIATDEAGASAHPKILPLGKTPKPMTLVGIGLWFDYFSNPNRLRLKQCWHCRAWFVDRTKNQQKHFCTSGAGGCSGKWWSRPVKRQWSRIKRQAKTPARTDRQPPLSREEAITVLTKVKQAAEKKKRRT